MKLPAEVFAHHSAVVGKTGSGKTSTAKLMVEHVAAGSRVCILDPIKSDWWGLISSADGKRPGLPFHILGGPHGHVPLHETSGKAIGELVASGALPLSIIDMADFRPGGLQKFFSEFAAALIRNMRGVVFLVIEEAHEFAPKERAGLGDENLSIHWAKKLATAGRSKGIRLILVTQRTQSLHNALLGSCETVIAHRLTLPADQKPVADWLKSNMDKTTADKVIGSMSSLKTGAGWVCSGEAKIGEQMQFPRIKTYDNSATPTGDGADVHVMSAPVDQDKLRAIIGDAVKEAEANDPKALRAEITRLKREAGQQGASEAELDTAHAEGFQNGRAEGETAGYEAGWCAGSANAWSLAMSEIGEAVKGINEPLWKVLLPPNSERASDPVAKINRSGRLAPIPVRATRPVNDQPSRSAGPVKVADGITAPQQRILDALAWLLMVGIHRAQRTQLAFLADASPSSSAFANNLGALRTAGLINYPSGGEVEATDTGHAAANPPERPRSDDDLHATIRSKVTVPQWRIIEALIHAHPKALNKEALAEKAGASPTSSAYANNLGALRSLGLIEYPDRGKVCAADILFLGR